MDNPIGISYPIRKGTNGYFAQSFDTKETIRDALANLILTPQNTRPGRPEYGSSLYNFLFEPIEDDSILEDILREDINRWIKGIDIISITADNTNSQNTINLNIVYKIKNSSTSDQLSLTVPF